jgi:hypothetical protein
MEWDIAGATSAVTNLKVDEQSKQSRLTLMTYSAVAQPYSYSSSQDESECSPS